MGIAASFQFFVFLNPCFYWEILNLSQCGGNIMGPLVPGPKAVVLGAVSFI